MGEMAVSATLVGTAFGDVVVALVLVSERAFGVGKRIPNSLASFSS